jgi:uncharacterized protein (TIGR03437 family)
MAAAFGVFITRDQGSYSADRQPLPTTLGDVSVMVDGIAAGLFFVSSSQINFLIPSTVQDGPATLTVINSDRTMQTGIFTVARTAPGLFSRRANGHGIAAALTTADGIFYETVDHPDGGAREVSAGTKERPNILVLYATGVRHAPAAGSRDGDGPAATVTVTIGGVPARVLFAGPAPGFAGLDQINVVIPPELSGINMQTGCLSEIGVVLTAGSRRSNRVTLKIGGPIPLLRAAPIAFNETKTGQLASEDQLQFACPESIYFLDAYEFTTTAPNTAVAIDLRSSQFNAGLSLYRLQGDNPATLHQVGFDDDLGGMGDGRLVNGNALLLQVLPAPGRYVILATTSDRQPAGLGDYTLNLKSVTAPQLGYGQVVNDAAITAADLQTSAGDLLDVYWFYGTDDDEVSIGMNSAAFDPLLLLQSNNNLSLKADDNGGGGRNALLVAPLDGSSVYLIIATPFAPQVTGAYALTLNRLDRIR